MEEGWIARGHKEFFEDERNDLYLDCGISQVCSSAKTYQIVHVKWMQFTIPKLYINKIGFKTKKKKKDSSGKNLSRWVCEREHVVSEIPTRYQLNVESKKQIKRTDS